MWAIFHLTWVYVRSSIEKKTIEVCVYVECAHINLSAQKIWVLIFHNNFRNISWQFRLCTVCVATCVYIFLGIIPGPRDETFFLSPAGYSKFLLQWVYSLVHDPHILLLFWCKSPLDLFLLMGMVMSLHISISAISQLPTESIYKDITQNRI